MQHRLDLIYPLDCLNIDLELLGIERRTGEKVLLRPDQPVPEGFVKKGGRKTRRSKQRKSKRKSFLKSRKIR